MSDRAHFDVNNIPTLTAVSTADGTTPVTLEADPNTHELLVFAATGGLVGVAYDYMSYTNTSSTVDTYTYKSGGAGGTVVATVTITYTDSSKSQVSTVART